MHRRCFWVRLRSGIHRRSELTKRKETSIEKTGKNKRTPIVQPSGGRLPSTSATLADLTDADLEQVQGARVQRGHFHMQKYIDKASPKLQ
jgi:hypothetical protein